MVIEGDLKNLMGRVTRVADDGKVDVMPSMEGLTQVLTFEPGQLEKFFEVRAAPITSLFLAHVAFAAHRSGWSRNPTPSLDPVSCAH